MFLDHAGSCRRGCLDLVADVTRYALIAALVALCAALGGLWWQSGRMGSLQADNDALRLSLAAIVAQNTNINEDRKSDAQIDNMPDADLFSVPDRWLYQDGIGGFD